MRGAFERQSLGEADYARLGSAIVGLAELAGLCVDRADIDDPAEVACSHALDHMAGHIEDTGQIDIDHRLPLID